MRAPETILSRAEARRGKNENDTYRLLGSLASTPTITH